MNIKFETLEAKHQSEVMAIFNYYVENTTAAFPGSALPEQFFSVFLKQAETYPAYALRDEDAGRVVGFCRLTPYSPFSTFRTSANVTYFIDPEYTGVGLGAACLIHLEGDAVAMGVDTLVAEVSSENEGSLAFHEKHDFVRCGELKGIGRKLERRFGVVYMQKSL